MREDIQSNIRDAGKMFADMGFDEEEAMEAAVRAEAVRLANIGMKETGYTQKQLAEMCGEDQPYISMFLRGDTSALKVTLINRILSIFGYEISEHRAYEIIPIECGHELRHAIRC